MTAGIVPPGAGHVLTARGSVMAFKAVAAQTGGDFSLMERTLPPGGDAYFEELHQLWSGDQPPSPDQERELMRRHGMEGTS